jgi:hypothetical protein
MAMIRFTLSLVQVWKSNMLVILLLQLNPIVYILTMSFIFPKLQKNLVSVHRLAKDNSAFLEFHPYFFGHVIVDYIPFLPILQ